MYRYPIAQHKSVAPRRLARNAPLGAFAAGYPSGPPLGGDTDIDGIINSNDYDDIDTAWLQWKYNGKVPDGGFRWEVGDFNIDGTLSTADYDIIDHNWLSQSGINRSVTHTWEWGLDALGLRLAPTPRPRSPLATAVQAVSSIWRETGHFYFALTPREFRVPTRATNIYTIVRTATTIRPRWWTHTTARWWNGTGTIPTGRSLCCTACEVNDWRRFLMAADDEATLHAIRLHGRTGRPLGDTAFVRRLERRLGRHLLPRAPGRPPKRRK